MARRLGADTGDVPGEGLLLGGVGVEGLAQPAVGIGAADCRGPELARQGGGSPLTPRGFSCSSGGNKYVTG